MDRKLTIMIVEDDETACSSFKEIISKNDDLELIYTTNDSDIAHKNTDIMLLDVVILDLELHSGKGSGIDYLSRLSSLSYKPFIVVTTNNSSQITYKYVHENGCDFLIFKNESDYSEQKVINFILSMKNIIMNTSPKDTSKIESSYGEDKSTYISQIFNKLGISPKLLGYKYLRDAIILVSEGNDSNIYQILGKEYNKTSASIEHAMQNAINKAWNCSDTEALYQYYSAKIDLNRGCPTITEFIYYYADKLNSL